VDHLLNLSLSCHPECGIYGWWVRWWLRILKSMYVALGKSIPHYMVAPGWGATRLNLHAVALDRLEEVEDGEHLLVERAALS
jgi:hypothetical protein